MSSTHGTVIERQHAYGGGTYRHLEMGDGTYAAIPAGMVCEVGDVVARLTEAEWRLLEAYRDVKPKQEQTT